MKLTDEEISALGIDYLGDCRVRRNRGVSMDLIAAFARAIEAAVEAKHAPKFKVGDLIEQLGMDRTARIESVITAYTLDTICGLFKDCDIEAAEDE